MFWLELYALGFVSFFYGAFTSVVIRARVARICAERKHPRYIYEMAVFLYAWWEALFWPGRLTQRMYNKT